MLNNYLNVQEPGGSNFTQIFLLFVTILRGVAKKILKKNITKSK